MTAEIAVLERRLDEAERKLNAKVDLVLAKLDEMHVAGKPGVTLCDFAKLIGKNPRTVSRWRKAGRIRLVKGLVPNAEVRKFLS